MTLPAVDSWEVRGVEGPPYRVGPHCSNPDCRRIAEHAHHIVRRSQLGGDYAWVEIPDGVTVGNLTGLCPPCHDLVTGIEGGHKAAIRYEDGAFLWCEVEERASGFVTYLPIGELDPQPPTPESLAARASETTESDACPTCGQTRRRPSTPTAPTEGRRRKTWGMDVPDDHEDGAEILDALSDDLALKLGYHNEKSRLRRYHAVWHALVFTQQNAKLFLGQLTGKGS